MRGKSRKDGRKGGGHRDHQGIEYWSARLTHYPMGIPGKMTKVDTHRCERRALKAEARALLEAAIA